MVADTMAVGVPPAFVLPLLAPPEEELPQAATATTNAAPPMDIGAILRSIFALLAGVTKFY
jgi:hypothetical protein